jgi:hypothetical protein
VQGVLKVSGHALQSFTGGNVVYGHGERSAQAVGLGAGYPTYNLVDASVAAPARTEKFERRDEDALAQGCVVMHASCERDACGFCASMAYIIVTNYSLQGGTYVCAGTAVLV